MSAGFVFLRPAWLAALAIVPLLPWLLQRARRAGAAWQRAVDPHLLPHLLERGAARRSGIAPALVATAAALAILALAGPSWRQTAVPLWQVEAPLVIALDLSAAMNAADLPPSRLTQARAKIAALLAARRGGQVGLVAFAGDAFGVAPITSDARTVGALLDSLATDIMPLPGQRPARAIAHAQKMLRDAGFASGDIVLLTDHADADAEAAAASARAAGFRVGALGVGTSAGAPVPGKQGFATGADGQIAFARLDAASLAALARAGGGSYAALAPDETDLRALDVLDPQQSERGATESRGDRSVARGDDGFWLLLPLMALALLGFRRGWLAVLPLVLALPAAPARADGWDALWQRADQRARAALDRGDIATARALAPDAALRGAAAFRGADYATAEKDWAERDDADAHYNRGNALAKAGRYGDALGAYDAALAKEPGMDDAVANRKAVADLLEQQKQQQQQQQQQQPKDGDSQQQDRKDQQQPQQQSPSKDGKPKDAATKDEAQQDPAQQDASAQQKANEAAKQRMQQALDAGKPEKDQRKPERAVTAEERAEDEKKQALEQWMRRVPDDPGALLRRRFALEYQRRQKSGEQQ